MQPLSRVTPATADVLQVLLAETDALIWGLRVVQQTGRPTGSVYPILERLEASGWVISSWEDDGARRGPRRRLYSLTPEGAEAARALIASQAAAERAASAGRRQPRLGPA